MIVRRLNAILSQFSSHVVAWVHAVAASAKGFGRQAAAPAASALVDAASQPPTALPPRTAINWLEDARRLRGRPAPRPIAARPATETLRQILHDPRWTSAFEAGTQIRAPRPSRPLDQRPTLPLPQTQPAPHLPAAPSSSTSDTEQDAQTHASETEDEARRRLTLIRDLVRRGLYNEGFKPGDIPDQYRTRPAGPDAPQDDGPHD